MDLSRRSSRFLALLAAILAFSSVATNSAGCTIFILVDPTRTLFFNNEDWSNTTTRVWFIPAGEGHLGGVYLGFNDGWAQGGMNTEGLAYDWVAGVQERWPRKPGMKQVRGNPAQRMLETCSTVEQAVQFFQSNYEPGFATARILVADKSGASAIIGAKDDRLSIQRSNSTRGFGYGGDTLQSLLKQNGSAALSNGVEILRSCVQQGRYATKYSNVFDLRSGDLFLYALGNPEKGVKLNLHDELKRGPHYFEIGELQTNSPSTRPLLHTMHRFPVDAFETIEDQEHNATARIRRMLTDTASGKVQREDYTDEFWQTIKPAKLSAELKLLGRLLSVTPVSFGNFSSNCYRIEFTKARLIQRITLTSDGKMSEGKTVAFELRPDGDDL